MINYGYNIKNNKTTVAYPLGIVDVRQNVKKRAYSIFDRGSVFPVDGEIVIRAFSVSNDRTSFNIAEFDFDKNEYNLLETLIVEKKKLREGDPFEIYATYVNPYRLIVKIHDGKSGKFISEHDIEIQREVSVPVKQQTPVRATATNTTTNSVPKASAEDKAKEEEAKRREQNEAMEKARKELLEKQAQIKREKEAEKKEREDKAYRELDNLVGLSEVKESIYRLRKRIEFEMTRNSQLGKENESLDCPRFVFNGNPGTGKTTVARLVGDICYGCGLLSKGHLVEVSRNDLVSEFVGKTSLKTKEVCEKAYGGVLFIDEAYSLVQKAENDFGKEAIAVLIKEIEDHRKDMVVILAGYSKDMDELLETNAGIKSRITDSITFADYSSEELTQIAKAVAKKKDYTLTDDGVKAFEKLINKAKVDSKFGNAREVRNILDKAISNKAVLYAQDSTISLTELSARDFGVELGLDAKTTSKELLAELERLTGLASVKRDVRQLINKANYINKEIQAGTMKEGEMSVNMNLCFIGNPGTGKTTVARIYAELLYSIGLTKTDKVIEVSRNDLVASYMGQTAKKTKELCEKAYGGVLFIDEAYSLVQGENDTFGKEALDTLIKEMEDNRDKLVVILAGYVKEMKDFMNHNSGLESRISRYINFEDYSADELCDIFSKYVDSANCTISDGALEDVKIRINRMVDNKSRTFGNAREIRKLYENIWMNMVSRVEDNDIQGAARKHITEEDVMYA